MMIKRKDGIEAIEKLNEQEIHLIILDILMPRLDGISTTFKIREAKNIPIIILSAKSEDTDKILGLQIGADDYMTKPFNPIELIARIKAQLRRYVKLGTYQGSDKIIDLNGLTLEQTAKKVTVNGEEVKLTPIEYKIVSTPTTPIYAIVDGKKLWRVFDNLIENILKYSLENTRVYITMEKINDKVTISFKNVSKYELGENTDELFERFKRGDTSRQTEGSGLGLAIAKSIIDLHGGRLEIEVDGDLFKATVSLITR